MSEAEAERPREGPGSGGVTGKGFLPGARANPGGRPKGLARKVREVLGEDDGETLARFWAGVLTGYLVTVDADGNRSEEKVSVKDRIDVSKLLAERGWGKPPQYAPIEDDDPLDLSIQQQNDIAAGLDARVDEVARQRAKRIEDAEAARLAAEPPA